MMQDLKVLDDFLLKAQIQVAWVDMDVLGHVNSSKYFTYFETARIKYYEKLELFDYFNMNKIYPVVARTECSYFVPLVYPDNLVVGAKISDLKKEMLFMEYFIKSELNGLSAFGEAEIAFYSFKNKKRISVPQIVTDKIIKFENCTFNE